ncbi:MAG: ribulose-phosphate 3-epimerase [Actinomycetaceae bacterium]|nr:ribulose-phosphate 3-epimerase [Actinomycetaceae bacterium]
MDVTISPSILNCDFAHLSDELKKISNAQWVHVDVMDNHFVPNLALGMPIVESVVRTSTLPVDAHLMIENPDQWAPQYAEAGCTSVTFHIEAAKAPFRLTKELKKTGTKVGVALRPTTPFEAVKHLITSIDMILIMTVEPGFGGQSFIEPMVEKIRQLRSYVSQHDLPVSLQVDGGINQSTIVLAAEAGADNFVAGSAVFKAEDAHQEIETLRSLALQHRHVSV